MKVLYFDNKLFGKSLKQHRVIDRDVSMSEVEKQTGLGRATISRIEHGNMGDVNSILNLCNWMNVSINGFVKSKTKKK